MDGTLPLSSLLFLPLGFFGMGRIVISNFWFDYFQAEVNFLGDLLHPNLVKLVGYCNDDDHRLLVYEFMPRGSLENHLFRSTWDYPPPVYFQIT